MYKNITIENAIENLISKSEKYKEIYKLLGGKTMKNTIQTFKNAKYEGKKLSMLTAYDYSIAKIMDECDINGILIGDSLGMVIKVKKTLYLLL